MSYSVLDAFSEQEWAINRALQTRDSEALLALAAELKEQGDDETADSLRFAARKIEREDWQFDEEKDAR